MFSFFYYAVLCYLDEIRVFHNLKVCQQKKKKKENPISNILPYLPIQMLYYILTVHYKFPLKNEYF